mmetsp:Transcript_4560/g.18299  ORF Transcript_4560/g.18299 Transcript_4560/m.18299 type:complete len:255 (+) Transcript_4560:284-1048(+)
MSSSGAPLTPPSSPRAHAISGGRCVPSIELMAQPSGATKAREVTHAPPPIAPEALPPSNTPPATLVLTLLPIRTSHSRSSPSVVSTCKTSALSPKRTHTPEPVQPAAPQSSTPQKARELASNSRTRLSSDATAASLPSTGDSRTELTPGASLPKGSVCSLLSVLADHSVTTPRLPERIAVGPGNEQAADTKHGSAADGLRCRSHTYGVAASTERSPMIRRVSAFHALMERSAVPSSRSRSPLDSQASESTSAPQ